MTSLAAILATAESFLLPKQASGIAAETDWLFYFILWVSTFFFAIIVVAKLFFIIKYRRQTPDDVTPLITHNNTLEVVWTGIPVILVIAIFFIGLKGFINYDTPPSDPYVIEVTAQKWAFNFVHPNGGSDGNLHIPVNRPVKLIIRSTDVLHAVYIPAFRVQRNAVPGRDTILWFTANQLSPLPNGKDDPGGFSLFCTQYCGDAHSKMVARVHVLDPEAFSKKLVELANPFKEKDPAGKEHWVPYVKAGEKFAKSSGCLQCHSLDGSKNQGPTWKDLYKKDHTFSLAPPGYSLQKSDDDGKWTAYFHESILNPGAKIVATYQNVMPSFASTYGGDPGTQKFERLQALTEYIKSLGPDYQGPRISGKLVPKADVTPEMYDVKDGQEYHPESLKAQSPAPAAAPDAK